MGIVLFLVTAAMEIGLALCSVATKSDRRKARALLRVAVLAVFALLVASRALQWSFRYYALAAVLLGLAAAAAIGWKGTGKQERPYRVGRAIGKAVAVTALLFAASLPAIVFPQHQPLATTGEYPVATAAHTFVDNGRRDPYADTGEGRKLNVAFWYPEGAAEVGASPLVVFSHGSMGIKTSNESLFRELASHGYVVCSIDHTHHSLFTVDGDGRTTWIDMGYMGDLRAEDAKTDRQKSYAYYRQWMEVRTADIVFVIDRVLDEAGKADAGPAYRLVDRRKIAVMGHSLGGSAALGIGRSRSDIGAVLALEAPFLCDIQGAQGGEFVWNSQPYPVPVLNIYSDSAWSHLGEWPQYAENHALLTGGGTVHNVHITGIGHLALTDLSRTSPLITRMLDGRNPTRSPEQALGILNEVCLAFFDCYLRGVGVFAPDESY